MDQNVTQPEVPEHAAADILNFYAKRFGNIRYFSETAELVIKGLSAREEIFLKSCLTSLGVERSALQAKDDDEGVIVIRGAGAIAKKLSTEDISYVTRTNTVDRPEQK